MESSPARPWHAGPTRSVLVSALLCCLVAAPASSQEDGLESFGETLDVVVVDVEAVVTDADGHRVPGLAAGDFRLLVDGREVPVDYFAEVRDGRVASAASETGAAVGRELAEVGTAQATNYLVFIDEYFSIGARRDFVVQKIAEQVRELPPQDRMAVVAFDGEELRLLSGWDATRPELEAALAGALERPAHGLLRSVEWVRRGKGGPWNDFVAQSEELDRVLTAVRSTLRMVPRPEGRNVLLALAGDWSVRNPYPLWPGNGPYARRGRHRSIPTAYDPDDELDRFFPASQDAYLPAAYVPGAELDDFSLIRPLVDAANLLGYTVYPVDVNGLRPAGGLAAPGDPPFTQELFRHGTLRKLGAETGGRALLFDERNGPLPAVVEDTRSYYSLGFTPHLAQDGTGHEIRVEVRRPGLSVRARSGYRDVSRQSELDLLAQSALRFGGSRLAGSPEEGLSVVLGEPQRRPRRTMVVPLRLDVPWRDITALPRGDGLVSRLEIRVAAQDAQGGLSQVATVPLDLEREAPPAEEAVLRWESDLTLRREHHDLVVSVYDVLSGQVLTRRVSVEP